MPIEIKTDEERDLCMISGDLSIWEAAQTWRVLQPLLCSATPLRIDLSGVESCDGAGIQILCQIRRAACAAARDLRIDAMSESLLEAVRQAGMDASSLNCYLKE
jgi:ABC-type transporter Mla MlaB component